MPIVFYQMFHEGIPYLNGEQERLLQNYFLRNVAVGGDAEVLHRNLVRKYCSRIARWLVQARDGDVFTYDKTAGKHEDALKNICMTVRNKQVLLPGTIPHNPR